MLLVGAGSVARDKFRILAHTGAQIRVVALHAAPDFRQEIQAAGAQFIRRHVRVSDLHGIQLLITATNDTSLNAKLAAEARWRGIWVNAVDDPSNCDAFFGSQLHLGPLHLALSSDGELPGLLRALRETFEHLLPSGHYGALDELAQIRVELKRLPDPERRRQALQDLSRGLRAAYLPAPAKEAS